MNRNKRSSFGPQPVSRILETVLDRYGLHERLEFGLGALAHQAIGRDARGDARPVEDRVLRGRLVVALGQQALLRTSGFANSSARGPVKLKEWMGISTGLFAFILIVVAAGMFWMAEVLEKKYARPEITKEL